MKAFDDIWAIAAARKGGDAALEESLAAHASKTPAEIAATPDDRILSSMARFAFQAGFSWKVIETKWPGFEAAFDGFDVNACAYPSEEKFDALLKDARIVRNARKILSVQANARFLLDLAQEHGSAARFFADWPEADLIGLLDVLKARSSGLGGETAMRLLRTLGKPAFITTRDVAAALVEACVLAAPPKNRKDLQAVQDAFNAWSAATGRDLNAISRTLALSAGPSYEPGAPPWPR